MPELLHKNAAKRRLLVSAFIFIPAGKVGRGKEAAVCATKQIAVIHFPGASAAVAFSLLSTAPLPSNEMDFY